MTGKRVFAVTALSNRPCAELGEGVHVCSLNACAPPVRVAREWSKVNNHPWHLMEIAEFTASGELVLRVSAEEWEASILCGVSR